MEKIMAKIVVSASSLPAGRNMSSQLDYLQKMQNYGADMYHIDVMDGKFVRSETIDYNYLEQLRENSTLLFDVHLMVVAPTESYIKKYAKYGANIITLQYEAYEDKKVLLKRLKFIKKLGCSVGLAVDIDTPIEDIFDYVPYLDMVCVMCVKVGAGGQKFNEDMLKKVKALRKFDKNILIEVDGGINSVTAPISVKAGADILAVGSFIYNNDPYEAIRLLKGKNNG